jgi:CheY-like chemotaxis protein
VAPVEASRAARAEVTILVVENEENNRCLMEQILGFAGYRYLSATNGLEALDVLDRERIDLVLIDLSMPVLDGYRATEIIRRRPGGATLPIVAVTAHAMSEDRELALQSGCTDYLAKPYHPTELLSVVERLLRDAADAEGL